MAVDHHGSLNELIRTFQKVMSRNHTSIIDQDRDLANLLADPFSCQVDILSFPHVTSVGKNLQVTWGQDFFLTVPSCLGSPDEGGMQERRGAESELQGSQ